jgi:hypothetical protein
MSISEDIWRIAKSLNINVATVANAVKLLGHTDEKKIGDYINQRSFAIVRKVSDGNGGTRRMTDEEFAEKFK